MRHAIRNLREVLAADIDNLTAVFAGDSSGPSSEQSAARVRQARAVLNHGLELAFEAQRGNRRRRRYDRSLRELADSATRLEQLSIIVADLRNLLLHDQFAPTSPDAALLLGQEWREPTADVLRHLATTLRTGIQDEAEAGRTIEDGLAQLDAAWPSESPRATDSDVLRDTVLLTLRRAAQCLK